MVLKDVNGENHPITKSDIGWILGAGWSFFFASIVLNIIYYMIHPSSVDISLPALKKRLTCGFDEELGEELQMDEEEKIPLETLQKTQ